MRVLLLLSMLSFSVPLFAQSPPTASSDAGTRTEVTGPLAPGARAMFNMRDAELFDAVRSISNLTGRRFLLGGRIRSVRLTIYSPTPVTADEAYQGFLAALETNGLTVVMRGGYHLIVETAGVVTTPLPVYHDQDTTPNEPRFVTRVHQLRAISAQEAASLLAHFRSRDGVITAATQANAIVLVDHGDNIHRMLSVLDRVDVPGRRPAAPAQPAAPARR